MAAPTTLHEYAQQRRDDQTRLKTAAQGNVDSAQRGAETARGEAEKAARDQKRLEDDEKSIRKQLADIASTAAGDDLLRKLESTVIAKRAAQARIAEARMKLAAAEE